MIRKIPFKCLPEDIRDCRYIELTDSGFAFPVMDDEVDQDSQDNYLEIVQVVEEKEAGYVLARPVCQFDEQEWDEISGAHRIETNPDREITEHPNQRLKDKYPSLVAAIKYESDLAIYTGMRIRVIDFKDQAGIVEAEADENGDYEVDELMVFVEKPYPAYWARIVLSTEKVEMKGPSFEPDDNVKVNTTEKDIDEDDEFDIKEDEE